MTARDTSVSVRTESEHRDGPPQDAGTTRAGGVAVVAGLGLATALVLSPLLVLGFFVRPASDDWCLVPLGRDGGFSAVVADVYHLQNGRLGNGAVLGVIYSSYPVASKLLPALVLIGLVTALGALWAALLRRPLRTPPVAAAVGGGALAVAVVTALLLGKPSRYQTLFHVATIVSHTMTILVAALGAVALVALLRRGRLRAAVVVTFLVCLFLGTFNEAFTAVMLVTVAFALVGALLLRPRVQAVPPAVPAAAGVGLLLAFISVYVSPGSRARQELIASRSLSDPQLWTQTVTNWWSVVQDVLTSGEATLLAVIALTTGYLLVRLRAVPRSARVATLAVGVPALWAVTTSLAASFVLSYSFNGQLVGRERTWPSISITVLLTATWLLVLVGALARSAVDGAEAGRLGGGRGRRSGGLAVVAALAAAVAVPGWAHAVTDVRDLTRSVVVRAVEWDRHDQAVRTAVADGARTVEITPVPIDGLYEPYHPNPGHTLAWPASCLPAYYGVDEVVPDPDLF